MRLPIFTFIAVCVMISVTAAGEDVSEQAVLTSYDVSLVNLDKEISRVIHGKPSSITQAYLVRLHGRFPAMGARLMQLYIGNELIEEYGGMPSGIYFMVYDPEYLQALSGKPFGYCMGKGPIRFLGKVFSPETFQPFAVQSEFSALSK